MGPKVEFIMDVMTNTMIYRWVPLLVFDPIEFTLPELTGALFFSLFFGKPSLV